MNDFSDVAQDKLTELENLRRAITEKEEELRNAKDKAEESDRLKTAFLANISHEIRTPLNGILGFMELLKEPILSGDELADHIDVIRKSGNRMLNTINDIIEISKIDSGLRSVSYSEINLNEISQNIYELFKDDAAKKGIEFAFKNDLPNDLALISSDRQKINSILTNLVKNAIKFTHKGRIDFGCRLISSASEIANELEFFVKDTGDGISDDQKDVIFERFRQTNDSISKNYEGAGLGLAITKSYVEMLGGTIRVESQLGVGSTFYFTLPHNPKLKEIQIPKEDNTSADKQMEISDLKILIAEDDEISAKLLNFSLRGIVQTILRAKNGLEAVDLAKNNPDIDLILMDIQMPVMDGYEATAEIRKFNQEVIIIAQTAFVTALEIQKISDAGCNDYTSKPVKKTDVLKLVDKYFKR